MLADIACFIGCYLILGLTVWLLDRVWVPKEDQSSPWIIVLWGPLILSVLFGKEK